ncbi:MAG: hypothetical protein ACM3Y9_16975 [Ignavibacteria bacterium]
MKNALVTVSAALLCSLPVAAQTNRAALDRSFEIMATDPAMEEQQPVERPLADFSGYPVSETGYEGIAADPHAAARMLLTNSDGLGRAVLMMLEDSAVDTRPAGGGYGDYPVSEAGPFIGNPHHR